MASTNNVLAELLTSLVGATLAEAVIAGDALTGLTADAGSTVGKFQLIKTTYDTDPTIFIDTAQNIDDLDDVVDEIAALEIGSVESASVQSYEDLQTASPEV